MKIRVLFFSLLQDVTGVAEMEYECEAGARVSDLLAAFYVRWPALGAWDASLLVAVDQTYAKRDALLHAGAEVALMPPVQGG